MWRCTERSQGHYVTLEPLMLGFGPVSRFQSTVPGHQRTAIPESSPST